MALSSRLYPGTLSLHDVRDVEAHVRTLLERETALYGARLSHDQKAKAITYLVTKCWELAGVEADGRTPRRGTLVTVAGCRVTVYAETASELEELDEAPAPLNARRSFPNSALALEWAAKAPGATVQLDDNVTVGRRWFAKPEQAEEWKTERWPTYSARVERDAPPPGAYDRARGLSFSTYSRRILAKRVVDWFRSELGDSRYKKRPTEISLEAAAARHDASGEAGEQFLDLLTPPSHDDPYEEVLTRVSLSG